MDSFITTFKNLNTSANLITISFAVLAAIVFGIVVFIAHKLTTDEFEYDKDFGLVLVLVPAVVALMISARLTVVSAISIAGVLAIVRYRSVQIKARDIAFIFTSVGVGFCAGMQLYLIGVIFLVIAAVLIVVYSMIANASAGKNVVKTLKIAVPESINYSGLFDATIDKYTNAKKLTSTSVISGGTVIELVYTIKLKNEEDSKAFIDELRVMNANFKISISDNK